MGEKTPIASEVANWSNLSGSCKTAALAVEETDVLAHKSKIVRVLVFPPKTTYCFKWPPFPLEVREVK